MNCEAIQERLVSSLDEGRVDSEVEQHCVACTTCREAKTACIALFRQLDSLPKPKFVSGDAFVQTLPVDLARDSRTVSTWEALCGLLARRPAFAIGFALICMFVGILIAPERNSSANAIQNAQSIENLTEEMTVLNESLAVLQLKRVSASERLRGVGWIQDHSDVNQDLIEALRVVLDTDENVNVRLAAIDALARFSDDPGARLCLLQSLEKPQSPLVRIALIEKLVPLEEPASVELFRAIVADEEAHEAVRERARSAMELTPGESV